MSRRLLLLCLATLAGVACSDQPTTPVNARAPVSQDAARNARERLARTLAVAMADPATRSAIKRRLDASNAPEGKLQFQALMHANEGSLMASLVRASASTPTELLADLDAARGLELYLPVAAQRAAWTGDAKFLVGTVGNDREIPVGFDATGARYALDPSSPPPNPVLALVPQETDFTGGQPSRLQACVDMCGPPPRGGGDPSGSLVTGSGGPGLYLVQSHFGDSYESWLKGNPEYEYHVYGVGDSGESVQLACTAEHATGIYAWDQNTLDWTGSVMLLADADYNAYQKKHPGAPVRIVAWEDDDEPCVDHANVTGVAALVTAVDNAYKQLTSGKVDPWYFRGIKSAPSIFSLVAAIHNVILTNDDFIGNGVEGTITGDAPNGSNWVLKSNGTITVGWFTTARKQ